ncbi:putative antirestriction adenine methyltransferase [Streptomyces albospinus]|uniref:putative antirestriction adenine methyltransferase n=1 Tax=Streptomyces albospinus TaxID=285515 RepID=UPI00167173E2|nr:hypothetical protein [Streptomyces albospinus]
MDITRLSVRVNGGPSRVRVVAVEPIGRQEIQSISTSSRTYIGEGYAMHNTGGYKKLYEPLNEHFTWDAPEYEPLSDADVVDVLGAITDRRYWLTASNHDVPELHRYLRGVIKATPRLLPSTSTRVRRRRGSSLPGSRSSRSRPRVCVPVTSWSAR